MTSGIVILIAGFIFAGFMVLALVGVFRDDAARAAGGSAEPGAALIAW